MPTTPLFDEWAAARRARIETVLEKFLPEREGLLRNLSCAMRYAVLGGGKRVRALLVYAAGEAAGASEPALDAVAAAVEMVHGYSLVHDDLPCMDNDVLRRGRPTCHVAFGYAQAMLAGDALQPRAFETLLAAPVPACVQAELVRELAAASGEQGMCGGQMIDIECVGRKIGLDVLRVLHQGKTGALIRASVLMGAHCGGRPEIAASPELDRYARALGLGFQIVDDILDVTQDSAHLGKTAGKDAAGDKPTYVSLLGLDGARAAAADALSEALDALSRLPGDAAARSGRLADLAHYIIARQS